MLVVDVVVPTLRMDDVALSCLLLFRLYRWDSGIVMDVDVRCVGRHTEGCQLIHDLVTNFLTYCRIIDKALSICFFFWLIVMRPFFHWVNLTEKVNSTPCVIIVWMGRTLFKGLSNHANVHFLSLYIL
jgi:hypothetical protein